MRPHSEFIDADCLLRNLKNGMELLLSHEERLVGLNSLLVRSIGEIVSHGLREPKYSFWHVVRELTHSSTRQCVARALKHVPDNRRRGLFWIYYTLIEGSLDSYMQCLVTDRATVEKNYLEWALLRDNFCSTKFVLLLTSLAQINIIPLDSTSCVGLSLEVLDNRPLPLDLSVVPGSSFVPPSSSEASSPADSGVHGSMDNFSPSICTPIQEKTWPSENTLTPLEAAFSDCSLSNAAEPTVIRRRKRVSFHETVIGDGPKGTVWERRSADVETMAWWNSNTGIEDHGEDALVMERGVPEGSDDPPALFSESQKPDVDAQPITPAKWKAVPKTTTAAIKAKMGRRERSHLLPLYPGPVPVPEPPPDVEDFQLVDVPLMIQTPGTHLTIERLLNSTVYKMFKMIDVEGNPLVCALTKDVICLLSLNPDRSLHLQRITYQETDYVFVGPSSEHITFQGGWRFLLTTRGEDFCSWLHYAAGRSKKEVNFVRISPNDAFRDALKMIKSIKVEDVIHSTWAVVSDNISTSDLTYSDHYLMFSLGLGQKFWEPAFVEISGGLLEIRPGSKGLKALSLPLKECTFCDRVASSRPHTFMLQFGSRSPLILILAAPDDSVMSNWMQDILFAVASCKSLRTNEHHKPNCEGHHLVVSTGFIGLVNSARDRVVSKALLDDIASLLTGPAYVILELDCHEVEDKASDWVLYFYCEELKNSFVRLLTDLKPHLRQMIFEHKCTSSNWVRCEAERNQLDSCFDPLISHIQSL